MASLDRKRGDTAPDIRVFNATVTGYSFRLTVSTEEFPSDTNEQIFQMDGEIIDSIRGEVHFRPERSVAEGLPIGNYFYDLEAIAPREPQDDVKTLESGEYEIIQDITK